MLVWSGHRTKVRSLAFSPDGRRLASSAERVVGVKLWDPATGTTAGELKSRWGHTSGVAFSPDGKVIATMSSYLVAWDAAALQPLSVGSATGIHYGPAFAPDGGCAAAAGWNGVALWERPAEPHPDTLRNFASRRESTGHFSFTAAHARFDSVAFDPTGARVAANGPSHAVVWDRATGTVRRAFPHPSTGALSVLAFSPDGARLAFSHNKVVEIHALEDEDAEPVVLAGHTLFVRAIEFTPDGATVMTASSDGTVRFWDAATGAPGRVFDWGIGRVYSAAFAPGGLTCAAGGEKGQLVVWDVDL